MKIMKNKKGFTLVELLAVIVILALIMSVAVVSMSSVMDSARRSTMKETAAQIIAGVRQQLTLANKLYDDKVQGMDYTQGVYYFFTKGLLEKGGSDAPLGGTYSIIEVSASGPKLAVGSAANIKTNVGSYVKEGSALYRVKGTVSGTTVANAKIYCTNAGGGANTESFVLVKRLANKQWQYSICLLAGDNNYYIDMATEGQLLGNGSDEKLIINTATARMEPDAAVAGYNLP